MLSDVARMLINVDIYVDRLYTLAWMKLSDLAHEVIGNTSP
jgi:hypothetical protein